MTADSASIRRFAGWSLVGGLSVAAAAAILALLTGSFDDTDTRVIFSSIGFAICSAVASAGAAARLRPSERVQMLGTVTLVAAVASFVLLMIGVWSDDDGSEGLWRAFGCAAITGIAGSHACAMLGAARPGDSEAVRLLTLSAVGLGAFDWLAVILPVVGLLDSIDEPWPRIFGATLVLLILTSALAPILRRLAPDSPRETNSMAAQMSAIADRIDSLNSDPGNRAPEIRAEVKRLKNLAQSFEN